MHIKRVHIICFSPTGTSRKVVHHINAGLNHPESSIVDITLPKSRKQPLRVAADELLVVAVPVYMGRVPKLLNEWFNGVSAAGSPAVCIVVYGNREYDNALLELRDILNSRGAVPIAGAAFIGEHSFATASTPAAAEGRPDSLDLTLATEFGRQIADKLALGETLNALSRPKIPGALPYGGITDIWDVDFISVAGNCTQCGFCAKGCPVSAIDVANSSIVNTHACITCCACIKYCRQSARSILPGPVKDASKRLNTLYKAPKKPILFI
ncbi:MAG: EFR1 family ferrodoxin [Deltaproteobacteria bacterium]|nr:EFR1 family ferrodoxin [Deltaproteobacteria bacterium]